MRWKEKKFFVSLKLFRTLFIIFFVVSSALFLPVLTAPLAVSSEPYVQDLEKVNRFLIVFDQPSLLSQWLQLKNSSMKSKLAILKENLSNFQNKAIKEILPILYQSSQSRLGSTFQTVINGILLKNITNKQKNQLALLPYVSKIIPDNEITVPSIKYSYSDTVDNNDFYKESFSYVHTGRNITIAIFDTGIDFTHQALNASYAGGYDFVNNDPIPFDDHGHGTHCAGIIAGNLQSNNESFMGIAPHASLQSYKVLDAEGLGYTSWFLAAFEKALDPNQDGDYDDYVDIISISAGQQKGSRDDLLSIAAEQAVALGVTVVAAAGNEGPDTNTINAPACAEQVIAVGAAFDAEQIASFSSRGSPQYGIVKPDIIAPGYQIRSTWLDNQYRTLSGTSMATPYIAGMCAWLLEDHPNWTPQQVSIALRNLAVDKGYNYSTQGYGFLSIHNYKEITENPVMTDLHIPHIISGSSSIITGTIERSSENNSYLTRLSYKTTSQNDNWTILTEELSSTSDFYYLWNTQFFPAGYYVLKLEVISKTSRSYDISYIYLSEEIHPNSSTLIAPDTVIEGSAFNCHLITREGRIPAIYLFVFPKRIPQIRHGSLVTFTTPSYQLYPSKQTHATIYVLPKNCLKYPLIKKTISIKPSEEMV